MDRVEPERLNQRMGLVIDEDIQRRIEAFARSQGSTPAEVVRAAFEAHEAKPNNGHGPESDRDVEESLYDCWSRLGFIGCVKGHADSPTDLSTNPKHMEGFGLD